MKTSRIALPFVTIAALLMVVNGASAEMKKKQGQQQQQQQQQQTQPQGPAQTQGGRCVPSGFARLTRNCSTNTGNCQRMPDSCNLGWCCP